VAYSFPTFWLGLLLIIIFTSALGWLPAGGMWDVRNTPIFGTSEYWTFVGQHPLNALGDLVRHLALPVITLVAVSVGR